MSIFSPRNFNDIPQSVCVKEVWEGGMRGKNLVIMQQEQFLRTQLTTSCSPSSPPRSCHFLWHGRHIKPLPPPEQSRDIYREKVFGPISILPITSQRRHPTTCRASSLLSMLSSHLPEKKAGNSPMGSWH